MHAILSYRLPLAGAQVSGEVSYVSSRTSSQSNALQRGRVYELPGYVWVGASVSSGARRIFGTLSSWAELRVSNLLDTRYAEPGTGGSICPRWADR